MFKRISIVFLIITLMICSVEATNVFAANVIKPLEIKAKASVLIDAASRNVILEKNSNEKLPIASITKIMSMLLIMEAIDSGKIKYEDMVQVSNHSYDMGGSQVYLKPGEEFTVLEMLKAVAIHSANDAVVALAEKVSGSEEAFVSMMNEKAKTLGMKNTNFLDCNGLTDEGHYGSAYDVALMSAELIEKHPKILEITTIWHDTFRNGKFSLDNTNWLINKYNGINGLKTGFTSKAGYCLSASAKRNNLQIIAVVLGEPDSKTRFDEVKKLLDYGYANYEVAQISKKGDAAGEVEVRKGIGNGVKGIVANDVSVVLKKGSKDKIKPEIKLNEYIEAPVKKGAKIGEAVYAMDGKVLAKADVIAVSDIEKASAIRLFFRMLMGWFGVGRQ